MTPNSCIGKDGRFIVGVHAPSFEVKNLRPHDYITSLGRLGDGSLIDNTVNFPQTDLYEPHADIIYEIANSFPFRGTTYINSAWADQKAGKPEKIMLPAPKPCSLIQNFKDSKEAGKEEDWTTKEQSALLDRLPRPLILALAQASTDPAELVLLAKKSCCILLDTTTGVPLGIGYKKDPKGHTIPDIQDPELFEILVNNPFLPDEYKNCLVLKPGIQGNNEITGEYLSRDKKTHVFEYIRRNSYIPWGHFASNMANDAIRYSTRDLGAEDMRGIRHLYYQRACVRIAADLGIPLPHGRESLSETELENLRIRILGVLDKNDASLKFDATLWGWNFGYGFAQSGHRLHASHQMIHQQNAMVPKQVETRSGMAVSSFSSGDLIHDFIGDYKKSWGNPFFKNYLNAIKHNRRTDGRDIGESSLVLTEDEHTILFVPKAQVCEWELQLMTRIACPNIIRADTKMRRSLDIAILTAVKTLETLGADMVTSIEFSGRIHGNPSDQHLIYSFIPRLPHSPPTFSEAQLRWISGCYPEDFAQACRRVIFKDE